MPSKNDLGQEEQNMKEVDEEIVNPDHQALIHHSSIQPLSYQP